MAEEGFLSTNNRSLLLIDKDPQLLLGKMRSFDVKTEEKWMDRKGS